MLYQLSYSPTKTTDAAGGRSRADARRQKLPGLLVDRVRAAPAAILLQLDTVWVVLLVLVGVVVATLALLASERDELTHPYPFDGSTLG